MREYIKEISKHSSIYSISNILTKAIGFFLIPIYTRYLTKADYGIISLLVPLSTFLIAFYSFGLNTAWGRFFFDFKDKSNQQKVFLGNLIIYLLIFGVIINLLLSFFGQALLNRIFPGIKFFPYIILVIWISYLTVFFNFKLNFFRIRNQSVQYGIFNFTKFLSLIVLTIIAIVTLKLGALGKFYAEFIISFFYFILTLIILLKDIKIKINFTYLKSSLKYGIAVLPHTLSSSIFYFADKFFLNIYNGLEKVAIYNIGFLFGSIMNYIVYAVSLSWSTFFMKISSEKGSESKPIVSQLSTYYILAMTFLGLIIILFSKEAIQLFATEQYYSSIELVPIFVITYLFLSFYYLNSTKIFFIKRAVKYLSIATVTSGIANLLLNYILVKRYGMYGAAFSVLFSTIISFIITFFISQKFYYIKYDWKRIILILLVFTLILIAYFIGFKYIETKAILLLSKLLLLLSFLMILYLLQFFRKSEIENLKNILGNIKKRVIND